MSCAHVIVVTLLLAAVGPATGMPQLLATGLVGVAVLALCAPVPPVVAGVVAVASGLALELAYAGQEQDALVLGSAFRLSLLAAIVITLGALHRRRNPAGR
jgi:hypothetical protein